MYPHLYSFILCIYDANQRIGITMEIWRMEYIQDTDIISMEEINIIRLCARMFRSYCNSLSSCPRTQHSSFCYRIFPLQPCMQHPATHQIPLSLNGRVAHHNYYTSSIWQYTLPRPLGYFAQRLNILSKARARDMNLVETRNLGATLSRLSLRCALKNSVKESRIFFSQTLCRWLCQNMQWTTPLT